MIRAELLTIGDEILFGQITNTNAQWMGVELANVGIRVIRHTSVGDNAQEIINALNDATHRAEIVLITGGLGPTKDDITKHTLANYFGSDMYENQEALAHLIAMLERRGRQLNALNRLQATQPVKAQYVHNAIGTAPGMWFDKPSDANQPHDAVVVSMPGVPQEMKRMMTDIVIPKLVDKFRPQTIIHKVVRTIGIPESDLAERIASWEDALPQYIKLAYLPSFGQVRLRLTGTGDDRALLEQQLDDQVARLVPHIADYVFATDDIELEVAIGQMLLDKGATLATAESYTGGLVGHLITSIPGSSAYFQGGIMAYDNEVKIKVLGVDRQLIIDHGAVSAQVAEAMAVGARKLMGTNYAVSTTGIAGPTGATDTKPVGLVYAAVAFEGGVVSVKHQLLTDRNLNIRMGAIWTLNLLRKKMKGLV